MHTLLRLPIILLELALRGAAGALRDLLRSAGDERPYVPTAEAEAEAAAAAAARREAERVAAEEARARRPAARPGAARQRTRPQRARPVAPAPEPAAHVSSEPEPVASFGPADAPGATLEVEAPWPGYDRHSAAEVIKRVRQGDEATRAVVLLYERTHKARKSVIAAAEATAS
jgi:hypothetical protein